MTDQRTRANYNTPAVQAANNINDGDEFLLVIHTRRGETLIYGSGDKTDTATLYNEINPEFTQTSVGQEGDRAREQEQDLALGTLSKAQQEPDAVN